MAFGCGIIEKCTRDGGVQALVLTPTRELAKQVKEALKEITFKPRLNIIAVYGGTSISNQIKGLKRANVIVATPGRLLDHIERGTVDLSNVILLVMDEADRMFDMGFIDDVKKIIRQCPDERQTLFFSATISKEVKKLANKHMVDPKIVHAGNIVDPAKLKQITIRASKNKKFSLLTHILKKEDHPLAMVFCNTRHLSDYVETNLRSNGIKAAAIHGGLTQNARLKAIDRFNSHEVNVLVCTDVAARGLNIKNVSHVINYDLPQDPNDYIHRIGRTARAGESGQVINILTNFDKNNMKKIQWQNKSFTMENVEIINFDEANITAKMGQGNKDHG
ncbi:MAG: DEAD/DEAH box helicase, partial [Thermoplasmata archaeon]|nr:DEAD/DEAH box helicase [Thermoplasmata archaeon]